MPTNETPPEVEVFAARVVKKLETDERTWPWLGKRVGISPDTLRNNFVKNPGSMKLRTGILVSRELGLNIWGTE